MSDKFIKQQQKEFLKEFCDSAFLAGGAVRDKCFGKPITDYDWYIYSAPGVYDKLYELGFRKKTTKKIQYADPNIDTVLALGNYDVILTKIDPLSVIEDFCLNICRAWARVDKDLNYVEVEYLPEFEKFIDDGIIRVCMKSHLNSHVFQKYCQKIHEKYPDNTFQLDFDL